MSQFQSRPVYGNCRVENIDGIHIFNTSPKRCKWYLNRGLAKIIQDEPLIIRLAFKTKRDGRADDEFYLQERVNCCVVCGTYSNLNKHHVVPLMYRRHFPDNMKMYSSHDVLPTCLDCHNVYEMYADEFKNELAIEAGLQPRIKTHAIDKNLKRVVMACAAIMKHGDSIPPERLMALSKIVEDYIGGAITTKELERISGLDYSVKVNEVLGKQVVERTANLDEFVKRWRIHFLEHSKAKYMPMFWDVNRIERARLEQ